MFAQEGRGEFELITSISLDVVPDVSFLFFQLLLYLFSVLLITVLRSLLSLSSGFWCSV
jgi:hypothetical protein